MIVSIDIHPTNSDKSSRRPEFTLYRQINPKEYLRSIVTSFHVSLDDADKIERFAKATACDLSRVSRRRTEIYDDPLHCIESRLRINKKVPENFSDIRETYQMTPIRFEEEDSQQL